MPNLGFDAIVGTQLLFQDTAQIDIEALLVMLTDLSPGLVPVQTKDGILQG